MPARNARAMGEGHSSEGTLSRPPGNVPGHVRTKRSRNGERCYARWEGGKARCTRGRKGEALRSKGEEKRCARNGHGERCAPADVRLKVVRCRRPRMLQWRKVHCPLFFRRRRSPSRRGRTQHQRSPVALPMASTPQGLPRANILGRRFRTEGPAEAKEIVPRRTDQRQTHHE